MGKWKLVGSVSDFEEGTPVIHDFKYETAALYRIGDKIFAIEDRCSHDDGPLADGDVEGCEVICPRHGARFDLKTGEATAMPASESIASYAVKIEDENVYVEEPED